jgi:hypothetical protein
MNRSFTLVIGEPGVGKTTAVNRILCGPATEFDRPVPHLAYSTTAAQLGRRRGMFSGTDALSFGINPKAISWLSDGMLCPYRLVIAEGDRLANPAFIDAIRQHWTLQVLVMTGPEEAAERRATRGSNQDQAWLKGRITKVRRLASTYGDAVVDASGSVEATAAALRSAMFPEWLEYAA